MEEIAKIYLKGDERQTILDEIEHQFLTREQAFASCGYDESYDVNECVHAIRTASKLDEKWLSASIAVRAYYLKNHTVDVTMPKLERLLKDVLSRRKCVTGTSS